MCHCGITGVEASALKVNAGEENCPAASAGVEFASFRSRVWISDSGGECRNVGVGWGEGGGRRLLFGEGFRRKVQKSYGNNRSGVSLGMLNKNTWP